MRRIAFWFFAFVVLFIIGCGSEEKAMEATAPSEESETDEETKIEAAEDEETIETKEEAKETSDETVVEETTSETIYEGSSQAGCVDGDGGKNYELYGTIVDAHGTTDYDRCSENANYPGRLYESYCKDNGYRGRETYDCPSGKCEAGVCAAEEVDE